MHFRSIVAANAQIANRRYYTLDGLRGLAAIIVLVGHFRALLDPVGSPRSWLAVDLFFILSGFVLGKAYEPQFARDMGIGEFMLHRYIRLFPLWIVGISLGIASAGVSLLFGRGHFGIGSFLVASVSGILMVPSPTWGTVDDIIPFDPAGWSLFFELVANLFFAAFHSRLDNAALMTIVGVCLAALGFQFLQGGGFGGSGWPNFWWGFPRVGFSFFLGVLINRIYHFRRVQTNWAWLLPPALIPLLFSHPEHGALVDFLIMAAVFPALVFVSATFEPSNTTLFAILGSVSYAIYTIHEPVLTWVWRGFLFLKADPEAGAPLTGIVSCLLIIAMCIPLDRFYDGPVRKKLLQFTRPKKGEN